MIRAAIILAVSSVACGDSGLVRTSEATPPWRVTIMTDPTPLRAGPVDVSVLVQRAHGGHAVLDANVGLELRGPAGLTLTASATRAQADNRLLYAAKFTLPAAGTWRVLTHINRGDIERRVKWDFVAADPAPPLAAAWPWLLPAPIGIGLFACNRALRRSRSP